MRVWTCAGCSNPETGKPAGVFTSDAYNDIQPGPLCANCWEVVQERQAELDAEEDEG